MILDRNKLIERNVIRNGLTEKIDDNNLPSYGMDTSLYTFRPQINEYQLGYFWLPPMRTFMTKTREQVQMPTNCVGLLTLKSTYSRQGLILVTNSPVDPGYRGTLTMRVFNSSESEVKIWYEGGLMQMTTHLLTDEVEAYSGRWQHGA